jgi:hypothetical protein
MSTPEERESLRIPSNDLMKFAAKGNKDALSYMHGIGNASRILDDLFDADYPVQPGQALSAFRWLLVESLQNRFVAEHAAVLAAYHASALSAWEEANYLEGGGEVQRIYGHVLRDWCLSIVPAVANLVGGYEHMRAVERRLWELCAKPLGG